MRTRSSKDFTKDGSLMETTTGGAEGEAKVEKKESMDKGETMEKEETSTVVALTLDDVETAKSLFAEGKRNFICGNVAEAVKALAEVSRVFGEFYGETAFECVEPYYYYGRTLLDLARKEPDVVANAVQGMHLENDEGEKEESAGDAQSQPLPDIEKEEKEEEQSKESQEDVRQQVLDALDENSDAIENGTLTKDEPTDESAASKDETPAAEEQGDDGEGEGDEIEEEGDQDDVEEGENKENEPAVDEEVTEEISNLQLSWEMLDLARVILEKRADEASRQRLADVRLALGEQAIEDESFDKAVKELEACIELQKQVFAPDDRRIAVSFFHIGVTHSLNEKYETAVEAFKSAVVILESRRSNFQSKLDSFKEEEDKSIKAELELEIKELTDLIDDVQNRIQDCIESRGQLEASKQAMNEFEAGNPKGGEGKTGNAFDDATPTDITHLVRKPVKRTSEGDGAGSEVASKKAKMETDGINGDQRKYEHVENGDGEKVKEIDAAATTAN